MTDYDGQEEMERINIIFAVPNGLPYHSFLKYCIDIQTKQLIQELMYRGKTYTQSVYIVNKHMQSIVNRSELMWEDYNKNKGGTIEIVNTEDPSKN